MARGLVTGGLAAAARFLAPAWRGGWAALILACVLIGAALVTRESLAWALAALAMVGAEGALYRRAEGGEPSRLAGLDWGRAELRLLSVWLLTGAFLFILFCLAFVLVLCFSYAAASTGAGFVASDIATWAPAVPGPGGLIASGVAIIGALGLAWAAARVCLGGAATIASGRVQMIATWPLTRRAGWRIALARALIAAAPIAALVLTQNARLDRGAGATWAISLAVGLLVGGLWLPMNVGLMAYLHDRLSPATF